MRLWVSLRMMVAHFVVLLTPALVSGAGVDEEGLAFFERQIRPVLVKECYSCHSAGAKALKGGLRLETADGLTKGGDSGPAVVAGKPEESLLLDALRYDGLEMPPKGKLAADVVAAFERWIKLGAPDPRAGAGIAATPKVGMDLESGREFWCYKSPRQHEAPAVGDRSWPRTEIDRFILGALETKGIRPAPDADRATLIRRLSFDLLGLPPRPEEVDAFVANPSPVAYEMLVDHLLASPRFGERWGRHWLDVARFAESLTLRGFVLNSAWRYRDYVIDAFNADLPFDRFVRAQVAGDLLPAVDLEDRRNQRIATAFLVLGNTNLEEQDKKQLVMDVVDEQLDTIGKAFLAQTIGCARCHDHKFDPIPTRDYYAMAGILENVKTLEHANVSKWLEKPLPEAPEREAELRESQKAIAALETRIKAERARQVAKGSTLGLARGALAAAAVPGIVVDDSQARKVGRWSTSTATRTFIGAGYLHDDNADKGTKTITFQPELPRAGLYEVWLAYSHSPGRAPSVPVTVFSADGDKTVTVNMRESPPIEGRFVSLGRHHFEKNGQGFVLLANEGTTGIVTADAVAFIPIERDEVGVPSARNNQEVAALEAALEADLKRLRAAAPRPSMALAVEEESKIGDTRVHIRGNVHNLGELAPRGFLRVAAAGDVPTFSTSESGRRELADWLAAANNPLTARVFVNRVWHWLFGAGIVRTTDNFGTTGETPSHPELLDELASRFMEDGWSTKRLVRRIVLSRTYQLSTHDDPEARGADPEDRLLWRMDRQRLDAECIRDAILSVSGSLRLDMKGPGFPPELAADYGFATDNLRRSVYLPVFRNALPDLFEAFDFADPSMVTGRRSVSTVAPQALFLMNHPFVMEQAHVAARRLLDEPALDDTSRITRAYRLTLARPPTDRERRIALEFVAERHEDAWATLFQALFASIDFRYRN